MERENGFLDRILQNRVLTHFLFWLLVWIIAPISSDQSITETREALIFRGIGMPIKMAAAYFLAYYQIPRLLQEKKYIQFALSFLLSTVLLTFVYRINNVYIAETLAGSPHPKESIPRMISEFEYTVLSYFPRVYFFAFIFLFIKTVKNRAAVKHRMEILQREKATAELNFLKAQIHPHFLFNTLNNLYVLTLDKSDSAPDLVVRLSEMLDYMLYQCKEEKVGICKELELLKNYIDLEKLRYGDRLQLDVESNIDDPQTLIAPLILVSIVENAFKHGVSGTIKRAVIKVHLRVSEGNIYFRVYNTKPSVTQRDSMNYKKGIGLKNVQRQLELIYPDQSTWKIEERDESYEINLWIRE